METELRQICPGIPVGKILIQRDKITTPHFYYANLPKNIASCHVLLLEPMLATGKSALAAIEYLLQHGVAENHIIMVNFLSTELGLKTVLESRKHIRIVTGSIEHGLTSEAFMLPGIGDFGDRYYGTTL